MGKTVQKSDSFWGHFDSMFDSMDNMIKKMPKIGMDFARTGTNSVSVTQYQHNGQDVEIRTDNGKTTVKVNGEVYAPVKEKKK